MLKKLDLWSLCVNAALAFLIGLAGAGCLCTAFALDVAPGNLLLACAFWAVAISVAVQLPKGGWICAGLMALFVLHFWWKERWQDLAALANVLFDYYHAAYGWTLPDLFLPYTDTNVTFAVSTLAALCTMLTGLSLYLKKTGGAVFAASLLLIPCLVVTDTVPDTGWLFVLLMLMALLLLTSRTRRIHAPHASRLCALLLIPVLLSGWLLFALNPKDTYDKASKEETFGGRVLELLDKLPFVNVDENGNLSLDVGTLPPISLPELSLPALPSLDGTLGPGLLPDVTIDPGILDIFRENVSLENAGPRFPVDVDVMQVTTDYRGVLYLRERGYDLYTGKSWDVSGSFQELYLEDFYAEAGRPVQVQTYWAHDKYYVPYYLDSVPDLANGYLSNPRQEYTYTFSTVTLREDWRTFWLSMESTPLRELEAGAPFTALPEQTAIRARSILNSLEIGKNCSVVEAAMLIQEYVRSSAAYDLNTPTMPKDSEDFAIWFLQESDTGYCVHFATAATVLLRAAGIPARYVEGYLVEANRGTTTVSAADAHAWVEYLVPHVGWVVLEATPGDGDEPVLPPITEPTTPPTTVPPVTTEPTVPPTTVPPVTTEPTAPSTTVPPATTEPTAPPTTVPTKPTVPSAPPTTAPGTVSTTAPTTVPGTTSGEATVPPTSQPDLPTPTRPGLWVTLSVVLLTLALGCALVGQWQLRLWLRQVWICRGNENQQTLKLWRLCRYMARLRRQAAPAALRDLAWKAKYSQYTMTQEELQTFRDYLQRSEEHLRKRPWYLRVVYRIVFAAY